MTRKGQTGADRVLMIFCFAGVLFMWLPSVCKKSSSCKLMAYVHFCIYRAHFRKTFTKSYSDVSQEMDFEAASEEVEELNRKPV